MWHADIARVLVDDGHWHTLEAARSCPDQCLTPAEIKNIERAERRGRVDAGGFGCYSRRESCELLRRPPERCSVEPGACRRVWEAGPSHTGPLGWLRFLEHVARWHHSWLRHGLVMPTVPITS